MSALRATKLADSARGVKCIGCGKHLKSVRYARLVNAERDEWLCEVCK